MHSFLHWEFEGHTPEINDFFREFKSRGHDMTFEGKRQHLSATFHGKPEGLRELTEYVTLECDSNKVSRLLFGPEDTLGLAEVELGAEGRLIGDEFPMAIDFAGVFYADIELILIVDEDVANVHLGDAKLCLRAASLPGHVECESFLAASDVAEGSA